MDIQNYLIRGRGSSETIEQSSHVFLSFCGMDTSHGFMHRLHHGLLRAGIRVLKDDYVDRVGELSTLSMISDSKIAIPILSENYASTTTRLLELAQMVECHKTTGQIIMPVFFNVTPSFVKESFRGHPIWKEALGYVGSIPGLEIDSAENGRAHHFEPWWVMAMIEGSKHAVQKMEEHIFQIYVD